MKNLFYSPTEKIIFWIAPYLPNDCNVQARIDELTARCHFFTSTVGVAFNQVKVQLIYDSSKYKYMELYWVEDQKIKVPEGATTFIHNDVEIFNIGNPWTVWDWIER